MTNAYLINETLLFEPDKRRLCLLAHYPERVVTLHAPVSECLHQLFEYNEQVLSQRALLAAVWEKQGAVVSTNALYQTIASIRKALKTAGMAEEIIVTVPKMGFKSVAKIQAAPLETFITAAADEICSTVPASPPRSSRKMYRFFSSPLAYALAGLLFFASCAMLYNELKGFPPVFERYQYLGGINGCKVYSSWHDIETSKRRYKTLNARYPVSCPEGGVAYMTHDDLQQGTSVIFCDKNPDTNGAQCDAVLYREPHNDKK